jgi:hypothetical protein
MARGASWSTHAPWPALSDNEGQGARHQVRPKVTRGAATLTGIWPQAGDGQDHVVGLGVWRRAVRDLAGRCAPIRSVAL